MRRHYSHVLPVPVGPDFCLRNGYKKKDFSNKRLRRSQGRSETMGGSGINAHARVPVHEDVHGTRCTMHDERSNRNGATHARDSETRAAET